MLSKNERKLLKGPSLGNMSDATKIFFVSIPLTKIMKLSHLIQSFSKSFSNSFCKVQKVPSKMKINHVMSSIVNKCLLIVLPMSDCSLLTLLASSPFFSLAQMLAATLMIAAKTTL